MPMTPVVKTGARQPKLKLLLSGKLVCMSVYLPPRFRGSVENFISRYIVKKYCDITIYHSIFVLVMYF